MKRGVAVGVAVFGVSVFVHFLWESLQSFAYTRHGAGPYEYVLICFRASAGDAGYMVLFYGAGWALFRTPEWIGAPAIRGLLLMLALGLVTGLGIEWWALATGAWSYSAAMPTLPGLGVGVLPVLQMLVLPPFIFWVVGRLVR